MRPKPTIADRGRGALISLALSVTMLLMGIWQIQAIDLQMATNRLAVPLGRLLAMIAVGLALGQTIEAAGWTHRLSRLVAPLFRFARLGPHCGVAFTTAFLSGTAANAMLFDHWQEGRISRYQLFLTNLANQLPAFFLHLPTTVFIVLPLTGWAGGLYFAITLSAALLRFGGVLMFGHLGASQQTDKDTSVAHDPVGDSATKNRTKSVWDSLKQRLPRRLLGVGTYVVPIYTAVFLLNSAGLFDWTRQWLAHRITAAFIPIEALSLVVLSFAAEFTSGFAAAGALLKTGVLTTKQAVLALLIGNVVAFPIRALRHQLPRLMGIFKPVMGLQLLLLGQGFRIASLILVGGCFYMWF